MFKRKILLTILLIVVFLSSCKKSINRKKIQLKQYWEIKNVRSGFSGTLFELYENKLYYLTNKNNKYFLNIFNLTGKLRKKIEFKQGRGPGRLYYPRFLKIKTKKIYLYDPALNKISYFNIEGKFLDSIKIKKNIGKGLFMDMNEKYIFFNDMFKNKIVKVNFLTGIIKKKIKYIRPLLNKKSKNSSIKGEKTKLSNLLIDGEKNKLYIANISYPYLIEKYDFSLNKIKEFSRPINNNYDKLKYTGGRPSLKGNIIINGLAINNKYLYAAFGGGHNVKQNKIIGYQNKFYISVFKKNTGEFICELYNPKINIINGWARLVGVNKKNIIVQVTDFGTTMCNLIDKKNNIIKNYILIFNNNICLNLPGD